MPSNPEEEKDEGLAQKFLTLRFRYFLAISLGFIAISQVGELLFPFENYKILSYFVRVGISILIFSGTILLTIGIAKLYFEYPETRQYFRRIFLDSVADILERRLGQKEFVDELSDQTVNALHYELVKRSADIDFSFDSTFFQTMRNEIEPLLGKIHYENLDIHIDNHFKNDDGDDYILSERRIETTFHTRTSDTFELITSKVLKQVGNIGRERLYQIDKIKVGLPDQDEEDMGGLPFSIAEPEEIKEREDAEESFLYPVSAPISISVNDKDDEGQYLRVIRYETVIMPINDVIRWTIAYGKSLRKISVHCNFDREVNPALWLFGIEKDPSNPKFRGYSRKKPTNKGMECYVREWEGWMLPYHGFIIEWD